MLDINGIVFSWWSKPKNEDQILTEVRRCVAPNSFDIYYTREILNECVQKKPQWYRGIIVKEQADITKFFEELLGQD